VRCRGLIRTAVVFVHVSPEQVLSVKTLRLDGFQIGELENLELMSHVTNFYAQHVRQRVCGVRRRRGAGGLVGCDEAVDGVLSDA
jgi:hypothetical protein